LVKGDNLPTDGDETAPGDEPPTEDSSKAFFLALAAKGKDAWNAWRRNPANKDAYVTFKGVDFSVAPRDGIDFSGFEFGDWADFSQCKWGGGDWDQVRGAYPDVFNLGRACFTDASFGHSASFEGAASVTLFRVCFNPRAPQAESGPRQ
jgi:uncharacterized protein YjbI with pentapeptide repeats